jgi:hypothetical protein
MDQLERLQTLITVADAIIERQQQGDKHLDEVAFTVALLIGREIETAQQEGN